MCESGKICGAESRSFVGIGIWNCPGIEKYLSRGMVSIMADQQDFQAQFIKVFHPVFMCGVAALELMLVIYTFYMEFRTGTGPSLLYTILPLSIVIAIVWSVLSVLITLVIVGVKNRTNP